MSISPKDRLFLYIDNLHPCIADVVSISESNSTFKLNILKNYKNTRRQKCLPFYSYYMQTDDINKDDIDFDSLKKIALDTLKLSDQFKNTHNFIEEFIKYKKYLELVCINRQKKRKIEETLDIEKYVRLCFPLESDNARNFIFSSCQYLFCLNSAKFHNRKIYRTESIHFGGKKIGFAIFHVKSQLLIGMAIEKKYWIIPIEDKKYYITKLQNAILPSSNNLSRNFKCFSLTHLPIIKIDGPIPVNLQENQMVGILTTPPQVTLVSCSNSTSYFLLDSKIKRNTILDDLISLR